MKISDYVFNIGDEVITVDGLHGEIVDICHCEECAKRGFFEPSWMCRDDNDTYYITDYIAKNNFTLHHKIGPYYFNPLERDILAINISYEEEHLNRLKKRLALIDELLTKEGEITYETLETN